MDKERMPVLIGAGQVVQREADPKTAMGPVDLIVEAARRATEDAGLGPKALEKIDTLRVVEFITGIYERPAELVTERLGAKPADAALSDTGGNTPQKLVNETAEKIARGETRLALLVGAEALASLFAALPAGITPEWAKRDGAKASYARPDFSGTAAYEVPYGFQLPVTVYPLFENALRAHYGRGIEEHNRKLGELFARFTEVAAENEFAWFRERRTAEEIATPGQDNRYVGFPYTKYMNAHIRVDQGAGVLMASVAEAERLGVPADRMVYLHGCADAQDHWYVSHRENLHSSPAIRRAGEAAFGMAGWSAGDLEFIDLYSCFPSAVQIGRDELGIAEDDPRPLTVTGGLPYHGGPANNYAMHSIATMMNKLRAKPGSRGICTALGWYITKHAIGLYSTEPVEGEWRHEDPAAIQRELDARPHPEVENKPEGEGKIEAYTVIHGRGGQPEKGLVIGRLDDGRRFLAHTPDDPVIWESLMREEGVGRRGRVRPTDKTNIFELNES